MSYNFLGSPRNFVWDVAADLPVVLQDGRQTYVYGLDLISATDQYGTQTYLHYDGLGSTTQVTDEDGDVLASYGYDVFGAIRSQSGSSANYWLFTGEQRDADSSLYYLRARYYDPATGRFLSQDPLPMGNLYGYVGSNPVNLTDPSGMCVFGAPCPDPRPLVDPVLDPLIEAIPEGSVTIPLIGTISYQLGATCFEYPEACAAAQAARMVTNRLAEEIYSEEQLLEGTRDRPKEGDAFQHCFWSGLITLATDAHRAERITTRYEAAGAVGPLAREQRDYDLENNKRGREFAEHFGIASGLGRVAAAAALYNYCR